ncbi:MAG: DUF4386 domain-containing protein [Methanobacteriota archaeon]|nr:MAG: DUF4386 domain-containing protein [Euryarchaeota archaeon]
MATTFHWMGRELANSDEDKNISRLLGAAFILQASASLTSGLIRDSLIGTGDITDTMTRISNDAWLMELSIAVEMVTAIGVVMLGALLYFVLKGQDMKIALIALGLYLMEVAAIVFSQMALFGLLHVSQESATAGHPENLQTLGALFLEIHEFSFLSVVMLFFALGAVLFYYLFYRSGYLPKVWILFGLLVASLSFIGVMLALFGIDTPVLYVVMLNLPFELGTGLWLLTKGLKNDLRREGQE